MLRVVMPIGRKDHGARQALASVASGPVRLALGLALLSMPVVAASLVQAPEAWQQRIVRAPRVGWVDAVVLALPSTLTASVVGGFLGSRLVRTRPIAAVLVAIGSAWPVGIMMLPISAAVMGIGLRAGILCIDTCNPSLTDEVPISGISAYIGSLIGGAFFIAPPALFVACVVAAWRIGRRRYMAGSVLAIAGYGFLHGWSLLLGGFPAFAALAFGVLTWVRLLYRSTTGMEPQETRAIGSSGSSGSRQVGPDAVDSRLADDPVDGRSRADPFG